MSIVSIKSSNLYPALSEMGVQNAHEISGYSLRTVGADRDVLKIRYKRAKGSLLPHSRTYNFGRSARAVVADGGTARMEYTHEISPFLLKAIAELDELVSYSESQSANSEAAVSTASQTSALVKELESLEAMVSGHVSKVDSATVAARFARLKAQVGALS